MASLDLLTWLAIAAVAFCWLMGTLYVLSAGFRDEQTLFEHQKEVQRLRQAYADRLKQLAESGLIEAPEPIAGDFDIVAEAA